MQCTVRHEYPTTDDALHQVTVLQQHALLLIEASEFKCEFKSFKNLASVQEIGHMLKNKCSKTLPNVSKPPRNISKQEAATILQKDVYVQARLSKLASQKQREQRLLDCPDRGRLPAIHPVLNVRGE